MNLQVQPAHFMNILDQTGHTTMTWNPDDPSSVRDAEQEFKRRLRAGYQAFRMSVVMENGIVVEEKAERITTFDPQAGKVLMTPQLQGG